MTCIVGLVHDGHVTIGGDSQHSEGWNYSVSAQPKVFRVGEFLIGCAGSIRMAQIIRYHLSVRPPEENETVDQYLVVAFVEALRTTLRDHGHTSVDSNRETVDGGLLVGYRGHLYRIDADYQAATYRVRFDAIGCGSPYALGVMAALEDAPPQDRLLKALEISARFSNGVCAPFQFESI